SLVRQLRADEAHRPFDLGNAPLLRTRLLKLSDEQHQLLFTSHHIISDGWSMGILLHEMGTLYAAIAKGESVSLPQLPIQYTDFALWQRNWLQGTILDEQLSYWRKQLAGAPAVLELPTDKPRTAIQTYQGETIAFTISAALTKSLQTLSRSEGVTLFMTLLAAFQALLFRYTGQLEISVGMPIAGRSRVETEGLIGLFLNTLVLNTDCSGEPGFTDLMRRVRDVSL